MAHIKLMWRLHDGEHEQEYATVRRLLTGSRSQCRASGCDWGCDSCCAASCCLLVAGVVRVLGALDDLLGPRQQSGEGGWHMSEFKFKAPPECVEWRKGDEQILNQPKSTSALHGYGKEARDAHVTA